MTQLQLILSKTQEKKLLQLGKQFYTELERRRTPFPNPTTLRDLKQALTQALQAQDGFEATWLTGSFGHELLPLQIIHTSTEVRNLPWQLALEGNRALPLVKSKAAALAPHEASQSYPLKVLIMVAAPEGVTRLDYEKEELELLKAFSPLMSKGLVKIHFTEDGALETLAEKLLENKYHILHFSGHGKFDEDKQVGTLALEDALTGNLHLATAHELNAVFKEAHQKGHRPDMVLLSACQTAQGTAGDVTGIADTLLEGGIPAVLAMSASVLDNIASFFAADFYKRIAEGYKLPYAFQQSCWAVRDFEIATFGNLMQQANVAAGQWLIPQLLMSQVVEHLVDKNAPRSELDFSKNMSVVKGDEGLLELRVRPKNYVFVGRRKEKRTAFNALKEGKSVLLRGQGGVGKTALAEHLAIRLLVRDPRTKVFTHSEKVPAADSLLKQMTEYLTKEHKQFEVVSELSLKEKLTDKFLYLLAKVAKHCEPLFIFDNVESFQSYDETQAAWAWNINQHEDVFTLLQLLDQYSDFPMLVTGRYPLAEFPDWTLVNMNSAPFGDFFKKCSQLHFYEIAQQLRSEKATGPFKNADQKSANFEQVVRLLYDTLGGNYRALEFFDEAYQKDKAGIFKLLQELANLKESKATGKVLHRMSENLVFEQLLAYLDAPARDVLSLLTRFNIPVLPMAIGYQRTGINPSNALQKLTQLTLAEKQVGSDRRSRYYVIPLVKELLQQVQFEETPFDTLQAGAYHEYVFDEKLYLDIISEEIEAFEFYYQVQAVDEINRVGWRLNDFYYRVQQFRLSLVYGLRTEEISQEKTDGRIWNYLGIIFKMRGQLEHALHYQQKLLINNQKLGDYKGESQALYHLAKIAIAKGSYDIALDYLKQALKIQQKIDDSLGKSNVLNVLSTIAKVKGNYDIALDYLEQALKIQQKIDDYKSISSTLNNIATIFHHKGDCSKALVYLEQILKIEKETANHKGKGVTLNNISQIYHTKGDYNTALNYLEQALKIQQEIGDRENEGTTLNNISLIFKLRGDYDTSLRYLEYALKIQQQTGNRQFESTILNNLASVARAKRNYDIALDYLEKSLVIKQEIGDVKGKGVILNNLATNAIDKGYYNKALDYLEQSLNIQQEIGDRENESTTLNNLSSVARNKGDYNKTLGYLKQSLKIRKEIGDQSGIAKTLHKIGIAYFEQDQYEAAIAPIFQAYQILERIGSPNAKKSASYLNAIIEKIGEARFQAILQQIQAQNSTS